MDGNWAGTYYYKGVSLGFRHYNLNPKRYPPTQFRAAFSVDENGSVTGSIVDDGPFGAADISGSRTGQGIQFTKVYRNAKPPRGMRVGRVRYDGSLSNDGVTMSGTWMIESKLLFFIPYRTFGTWEASRA